MYPSGYQAILEAFARGLEPRSLLSVSDWAEEHRHLSPKSSAEPGRWKNARIPYLRAIMDALDPGHPAPLVVFMASSQVGKSECGINWIGRTIHQQPASFLCLFPAQAVGRKWVKSRLDPMIASSPVLRALVPLGRKLNAGNTLAEKHFPGGVLYTGSANIPDDVASISVAYLLLDEVDRMPPVLEDEGDPIELALRRQATFSGRSKAFLTSTPTTEETSRIQVYWDRSTKDRYLVPCIHCDHPQALRWAQVSWLSGKPHTAVYVCEECSATIEEHHKPDLLQNGRWQAEHPDREAEVKGFHVNGLYTPIGLGDTWGKHAEAWERAQGKEGALQVFFNTRLGEIHKGERRRVQWETLRARAEPYKLRTIVDNVLLLTSGTDVQGDRLETQVLGHGRGEKITVVDYVIHYGDTTRPEVWQQLDEYLSRELVAEGGHRMRLALSLIDAGFLPDIVLGFTRTRGMRGIYASRGSQIAQRQPIGKPSHPDIKFRGEINKRGAERYEIGVSVLKHWLFELLRADEGDAEHPVLPADRHIRFSDELPEEYYRQLCAETFDPKKGWIQRANYGRNEALDTFVLARAAAMHHKVAIHKFRDYDWERLERQRASAPAPATSDISQVGKVPVQMGRGEYFPMAANVRGFDFDGAAE